MKEEQSLLAVQTSLPAVASLWHTASKPSMGLATDVEYFGRRTTELRITAIF